MDNYAATEQAYKNGYEKGYADAKAEIVRCKDCKHQQKYWHPDKRMKSKGYYLYWCDRNDDPFVSHTVNGYDDEFCSYGERRNDG